MDDNINRLEEIDRYLSGEMKPEETAAFEAELERDQALREALERGRKLVAGIRASQKEAFKKKLAAYEEEHAPYENDITSSQGLKWWRYAAVFLLLLACGVLFYIYFYQPSTPIADKEDKAEELVGKGSDSGLVLDTLLKPMALHQAERVAPAIELNVYVVEGMRDTVYTFDGTQMDVYLGEWAEDSKAQLDIFRGEAGNFYLYINEQAYVFRNIESEAELKPAGPAIKNQIQNLIK